MFTYETDVLYKYLRYQPALYFAATKEFDVFIEPPDHSIKNPQDFPHPWNPCFVVTS